MFFKVEDGKTVFPSFTHLVNIQSDVDNRFQIN